MHRCLARALCDRARVDGEQATELKQAAQAFVGAAFEMPFHDGATSGATRRHLTGGSARLDVLRCATADRFSSDVREADGVGRTYSMVESIYGTPRLPLPFEGLMLAG